MSTTREDITRRIKALRDKTTANGCTEAEAMAAMAKMEQLMNEHHVSHADLGDIDTAQFGAMRAKAGILSKTRTTWHPAISICGGAVIRMCGCEHYQHDGEFIIFGERGDCETAVYLIDLVTATANRAWHEYWAQNRNGEDHAARERASFMHGFGSRVAKEAHNLTQARNEQQREAAKNPSDSMALMLVKKDAIVHSRWNQYLASKGVRLVSSRTSHTTSSSSAYGAGNAAGGRMSFGGSGARVSGGARRLN
jgi:hypothetical protein